MIIFLIGFMGSGKTTTGKKLASHLNYKFIDLDNAIEIKENKTITNIFSENGEDYFRKLEKNILKKIANNNDNIVIATGGGTACFFDNMDFMNNAGITIYIKMDYKSLFNRLKKSTQRPLLDNKSNTPEAIYQLLEKRKYFYEQSKIIINGLNLNLSNLINQIIPIQY